MLPAATWINSVKSTRAWIGLFYLRTRIGRKSHAQAAYCKHLDQMYLQHIFLVWRLVAQVLGLGRIVGRLSVYFSDWEMHNQVTDFISYTPIIQYYIFFFSCFKLLRIIDW